MTTRMYNAAVATWSPFAGCEFGCTYCKPSFQAQAKRQRKRCMKCYNYEPHEHPERLNARLPRTGFGEFIFCCSMGDIAWCPADFLGEIIARIRREEDRTFLMQTKDPRAFINYPLLNAIPANVIIGTTLESNRHYRAVSRAPRPEVRAWALGRAVHRHKMVTVEPVMEFDLDPFAHMILAANPCLVWIGYDSRNTGLPEPSIEKVRELTYRLLAAGVRVQWKGKRLQETMGTNPCGSNGISVTG